MNFNFILLTNQMDSTISKFLKANRAETAFNTHYGLIEPKGRYAFSRQNIEEFWNLYCDILYENENAVFGIAEKTQQWMPVVVDVDLKMLDDGDDLPETLYTDTELLFVIKTYQDVLKEILSEYTEEELVCVVLEKDLRIETKGEISTIKNGFHLHFPYIFLEKNAQETQLLPRVQDRIDENETFAYLNLGEKKSSSVIDKGVYTAPWLLYGSKKTIESKPYKATRYIDSNLKEIDIYKALKHYQIYDDKERLIKFDKDIEYYLPRILSVIPYNRQPKDLKRNLISPIKEKLKEKAKKISPDKREELSIDQSLEIAKELLPMLSVSRAEDRNEWMTVGWVLYNISGGTEGGLELWCEFSERCNEKYDENTCIYQWERMVKKDYTLGTLRYFASIDSPELYRNFKNRQIEKYIIASIEGSHNDIAKALWEQYGDTYTCASITNKIWFHFNEHKWEQIEEGFSLREKISGSLTKRYSDYIQQISKGFGDETKSKSDIASLQQRVKQVAKMIGNLKSAPYKNNVMKECMEVFYNKKFSEKLDSDPYLIAFKNGVYDLKNNIFRNGRPEDYISKSLPINYKVFSHDDPEVLEVHSFLEKVFPDKSIRKYFIDTSSDIFVGGNHEKTVHFWTGEGDNGKSVTQTFFDQMLGKLSIKCNTNLITSKKPNSGTAFPELARSGGGVRLLVMEEPEPDETISIGILKNLSGNDKYYARDLFEKGKETREITPMYKIKVICNKLPRIPRADKAVGNRIRVIPFEATFCKPDNPAPETYEEQLKQKRFPMDKNFSKKIPNLVEAFCWILLENRKTMDIIIEPEKVRMATASYMKTNDIYKQFLDEEIKEEENKLLSLTDLYSIFKDWFKNSIPGQTVPMKNDVEDYFTQLWGHPMAGKKWKGYRQRTLQDDIESGDAILLLRDEGKYNPLQ